LCTASIAEGLDEYFVHQRNTPRVKPTNSTRTPDVVFTPALVVDGVVKLSGKVPSFDEARRLRSQGDAIERRPQPAARPTAGELT